MVITEYDAPEFLGLALVPPPDPDPDTLKSGDVATAPVQPGTSVRVRGLRKVFGARTVLDGVDLDIAPGTCVAVIGRSGCGKTTLLRLLAGLDRPDAGLIGLDGRAPQAARDDVRIMFQDPRLLPWRRVAANVALGLRPADSGPRSRAALRDVGLADRAHDWPAVLSGGQKQRVALARALVHQPRLLLLDEPLGALDALTRIEMQQLIESLRAAAGFTAVLVTHDVDEAVALADRVVLLEAGRVVLDQPVDVPRPRRHGDALLAELAAGLLRRVLRRPAQRSQGMSCRA